MCEEIKEKVIVSLTKEGYRREINEDGRIPVMKGFPKIHKENVKLRPVLDCRGNVFEPLEEKIKKVAEVIRGQKKKEMAVSLGIVLCMLFSVSDEAK